MFKVVFINSVPFIVTLKTILLQYYLHFLVHIILCCEGSVLSMVGGVAAYLASTYKMLVVCHFSPSGILLFDSPIFVTIKNIIIIAKCPWGQNAY